MPRLSHSEVILAGALRDLRRSWQETSSSWRDKARADFEKDYVDELLPALSGAMSSINEVNRLLQQAINECS